MNLGLGRFKNGRDGRTTIPMSLPKLSQDTVAVHRQGQRNRRGAGHSSLCLHGKNLRFAGGEAWGSGLGGFQSLEEVC